MHQGDLPQEHESRPERPGMPEAVGAADVHDQRQQGGGVADFNEVEREADHRSEAADASR